MNDENRDENRRNSPADSGSTERPRASVDQPLPGGGPSEGESVKAYAHRLLRDDAEDNDSEGLASEGPSLVDPPSLRSRWVNIDTNASGLERTEAFDTGRGLFVRVRDYDVDGDVLGTAITFAPGLEIHMLDTKAWVDSHSYLYPSNTDGLRAWVALSERTVDLCRANGGKRPWHATRFADDYTAEGVDPLETVLAALDGVQEASDG